VRVFDGALDVAGAFADADAGETDPGLPDDSHQPRPGAFGMVIKPVEQVVGPADVVPGVPVWPLEVEHVDDAELSGHDGPPQSATQARGQVSPQSRQTSAVSVSPPPVSTSPTTTWAESHSGQ
jgi:hypothetical protein